MGLTRLGILSLLVGDDDHAANLCMGGLCGQNQWAALWAKQSSRVGADLGKMPSARRTSAEYPGTRRASRTCVAAISASCSCSPTPTKTSIRVL